MGEKKFAKQYGIVTIGIFGSAARDEDTAKSDVDVVVRVSEPDLLA